MINYILGLIAGISTPIQTSLNSKYREKIGSPYIPSIVSFALATIIVTIAVGVIEKDFSIPFALILNQPWWIWLGGACGFFIVVCNIISMPHLGSAVAIMFLSFGQIMTGLVTDNWGLFGTAQVPMTLTRFLGAALLISGVVLISMAPSSKDGKKHSLPILYILSATFGGVCCALQVAINGTVTNLLQSNWKATYFSMLVGTSVTVIATLLLFLIKGRDGIFDKTGPANFPFKWYMACGGFFAFVVVASNSTTAPILGTGLVTVLNLIAQMSTGLVIDATGFLGIPKKKITLRKVIGVLIMVAGTIIIMFL